MKRCPECRRDYYDESMLYCLDDGAALVEGPGREPATELFSKSDGQGRARGSGILPNAPSNTSNAVAVLPFANLSRNEDTEYFSDGLAEELLTVLSRIKGLRVVARTSAFSFKGQQLGVGDIGRSLRVGSVLEGSVRMAGSRVRIAVRLVEVEGGYQIWSETYDRTMDDIFAIQDEIARTVVGQLRSRLLGHEPGDEKTIEIAQEVAQAVRGRAADAEAHRLMLLGRHLLERSNQDDAAKAMEYFRQALEIDPNYALCWAVLGQAYQVVAGQLWIDFEEGYEKAEASSRRALGIEPDLAEAWAVLGYVHQVRRFDLAEAERCFNRALELAPENSYVLRRIGTLARDLGRFDEALEYYARALASDPLSPSNWWQTGFAHFFSGDLSDAELAFRRASELAPQAVFVHAFLALVLHMQGRSEEALLEVMLETDERYWRPWALAIILNAEGRADESAEELAKLDPDETPFQIAEVHAMRGEIDEAFDWLGRTNSRRDPARILAKVSPFLVPLHRDPRWPATLREIGFPD